MDNECQLIVIGGMDYDLGRQVVEWGGLAGNWCLFAARKVGRSLEVVDKLNEWILDLLGRH